MYSYPHPTLGNVKGLFIVSDFGQGLFLFDFLLGNQLLLFLLNLGKEFLCGTFSGALFHQFALDGVLQEGFFHILREAAVKLLQRAPRLLVTVNIGQQFLDFSNNPLLLSKGWEGKTTHREVIFVYSLLSCCSSKRFHSIFNKIGRLKKP